ncbi:MAG: hypothetical protein CYPHOPRED_005629 [Cyphobasidiales sp. Tagirdzhanova-0007]|nr:MAG: hypothetical protein CYPHOPRED_005629 [Cyphobasidiales sp. Tagirdzhanova-0007]
MDSLRRLAEAVAGQTIIAKQQPYVVLDANAVELESPTVPPYDEDSVEDTPMLYGDLEMATKAYGTTYSNEIRVYLGYMAPLLVSQILSRYCTVLGPVSSMGKFGSIHLAGASLANTTLNVLGLAPTMGIASALDTLSTQAHGGSLNGQSRDLNMLYCLRVALVTFVFLVPSMALMWFIEPIFLLMGVEAEVASIAAVYMRCGALGMPAYTAYECLRKYLQAKGLFFGPAAAVVVVAPLSIWLMHTTTFGVNTPAVALALFFILSMLAEGLWAAYFLPKDTWHNLPSFRLVSQDLTIVFKLGGAGVLNVCSDWFAWEYLTIAAAWFGTEALAANSVFASLAHFCYALPRNYLGRDAPRQAQTAANAALGFGAALAAMTAALMGLNDKSLALIFTDDPKVLAIVEQVMPFFCIIVALDAMQGVYSGILSGAGMPIEIARIMVVAQWFIGLPLATILAFSRLDMGLLGLWTGLGVGLILSAIRLAWLVMTNDWEKCANDAQAHIRASSMRAKELGGE